MSVFGSNLAINRPSSKLEFTRSRRANFSECSRVRGKGRKSVTWGEGEGERNQSECFFIASPVLVARVARGQELQASPEGVAAVCKGERWALALFLTCSRVRSTRPSSISLSRSPVYPSCQLPRQSCLDKHERFVCIVPRQR